MDRIASLKSMLTELVAIDSTSALSNRPIIDLLETRLRQIGFECQRQTYRDDAGVDKVNLIGLKGGEREMTPELALVGHSDCVPYAPEWKEALTLVERDGRLYARGSCDTKAYLACVLVAAGSAPSLKKPLLVIFTADEELGCVGAKKLVEANLGRARYALIGEPSSLRPIRGNKGYCLAEVEVLGREGHSAYPESGTSAIVLASRLVLRLEEAAKAELGAQTHREFDPPYTTLNVGVISGGRAKNVIPGSCRFSVEWRPVPGHPPNLGVQMLERLIAELHKEDSRFQASFRVLRLEGGVESPEASRVVRFIAEQSGQSPGTVAFGTELSQLTALGAEAVVFGPGDIRNAHRTGEFVPIPELLRCEEILERAIEYFCN